MIRLLELVDRLTRCATPICRLHDRYAVRSILAGRLL